MHYFDLKFKESGNIESLFSDCFGRACRLLGFKLNEEYNSRAEDKGNFMKFEDDAVIYIIRLCSSFVNSNARSRFGKFVNDREEIMRIVEKKDSTMKFLFYKTNADFLLLSFGIVADEQIDPEDSIEMGKYCYRFASAYRQELKFGNDDLGTVLMKMAANFEKYADILACMKRNKFSPYKMYTDDEFSALVDNFLDSYELWKETGVGKENVESLKDKINDREPGLIRKVFEQ